MYMYVHTYITGSKRVPHAGARLGAASTSLKCRNVGMASARNRHRKQNTRERHRQIKGVRNRNCPRQRAPESRDSENLSVFA